MPSKDNGSPRNQECSAITSYMKNSNQSAWLILQFLNNVHIPLHLEHKEKRNSQCRNREREREKKVTCIKYTNFETIETHIYTTKRCGVGLMSSPQEMSKGQSKQ
jgi:hypothetical protein